VAKRDSNFNPVGKSRGVRRGNGETADWQQVPADVLVRAIAAAANTGGALRFGYSRDGGAYAIGIYGDGDPYTDFVKPSENLGEYLEDVISLFEDIKDDPKTALAPPPAPKQPK